MSNLLSFPVERTYSLSFGGDQSDFDVCGWRGGMLAFDSRSGWCDKILQARRSEGRRTHLFSPRRIRQSSSFDVLSWININNPTFSKDCEDIARWIAPSDKWGSHLDAVHQLGRLIQNVFVLNPFKRPTLRDVLAAAKNVGDDVFGLLSDFQDEAILDLVCGTSSSAVLLPAIVGGYEDLVVESSFWLRGEHVSRLVVGSVIRSLQRHRQSSARFLMILKDAAHLGRFAVLNDFFSTMKSTNDVRAWVAVASPEYLRRTIGALEASRWIENADCIEVKRLAKAEGETLLLANKLAGCSISPKDIAGDLIYRNSSRSIMFSAQQDVAAQTAALGIENAISEFDQGEDRRPYEDVEHYEAASKILWKMHALWLRCFTKTPELEAFS